MQILSLEPKYEEISTHFLWRVVPEKTGKVMKTFIEKVPKDALLQAKSEDTLLEFVS